MESGSKTTHNRRESTFPISTNLYASPQRTILSITIDHDSKLIVFWVFNMFILPFRHPFWFGMKMEKLAKINLIPPDRIIHWTLYPNRLNSSTAEMKMLKMFLLMFHYSFKRLHWVPWHCFSLAVHHINYPVCNYCRQSNIIFALYYSCELFKSICPFSISFQI